MENNLPEFKQYASGRIGGGDTYRLKLTKKFHLFVILFFEQDRENFFVEFAWSRLGKMPNPIKGKEVVLQHELKRNGVHPLTLSQLIDNWNEGWVYNSDVVTREIVASNMNKYSSLGRIINNNIFTLSEGCPPDEYRERLVKILEKNTNLPIGVNSASELEFLKKISKIDWTYLEMVANILPNDDDFERELGPAIEFIDNSLRVGFAPLVDKIVSHVNANPSYAEPKIED